jgi:MFS family permease
MTHDLNLAVENRYNIIALVFFIPYIIFEFPSTALVRQIGVRIHLATICFLWGCVMVGCGFVTSWRQLAGLRVLLGFFEAGFFPVCVYLLSTWYVRCK